MTYPNTTTRVSWAPAAIGTCLWAAATGLLLEEALHQGRYDVATMATPVLTAATVAAACLAHMRLAQWRIFAATGFLALALLGSTVMVSGTLGRLAEAKDGKQATIHATNRTYGAKDAELTDAKAAAKRECVKRGPICTGWQQRIDQLTSELSAIVVKSDDPKADAIARLVSLVGGNGDHAKAIVTAVDPVSLPLFLEIGSVLFFGAAFGHRKVTLAPVQDDALQENCVQSFTREQALQDLLRMKQAGSGRWLANRWGVDPATVSRWLQSFEADGTIERTRDGKSKSIAIAKPKQKLLTVQ